VRCSVVILTLGWLRFAPPQPKSGSSGFLRTSGWHSASDRGRCPRTPGILRGSPIAWQRADRRPVAGPADDSVLPPRRRSGRSGLADALGCGEVAVQTPPDPAAPPGKRRSGGPGPAWPFAPRRSGNSGRCRWGPGSSVARTRGRSAGALAARNKRLARPLVPADRHARTCSHRGVVPRTGRRHDRGTGSRRTVVSGRGLSYRRRPKRAGAKTRSMPRSLGIFLIASIAKTSSLKVFAHSWRKLLTSANALSIGHLPLGSGYDYLQNGRMLCDIVGGVCQGRRRQRPQEATERAETG